MTRLLIAARILFGGWMLFNGVNHFIGPVVPWPEGATPLAAQLLTAFANSGLLDAAMALELAGGALLLARYFVPFALALTMPVNTCALYWALVLNQEPVLALLALAAFALNGLLMLAHIEYYRRLLRPGSLAYGETAKASYGRLFANPLAGAPSSQYVGGFAVLLASFAFYYWVVPFASSDFGILVLIVPAVLLLAGWLRSAANRSG